MFNYLNGLCKVRTTAADCPVVNCAFFRGRFIAYGGSNTLYFYCGVTGTSLLKCDDGLVFDGIAG